MTRDLQTGLLAVNGNEKKGPRRLAHNEVRPHKNSRSDGIFVNFVHVHGPEHHFEFGSWP